MPPPPEQTGVTPLTTGQVENRAARRHQGRKSADPRRGVPQVPMVGLGIGLGGPDFCHGEQIIKCIAIKTINLRWVKAVSGTSPMVHYPVLGMVLSAPGSAHGSRLV